MWEGQWRRGSAVGAGGTLEIKLWAGTLARWLRQDASRESQSAVPFPMPVTENLRPHGIVVFGPKERHRRQVGRLNSTVCSHEAWPDPNLNVNLLHLRTGPESVCGVQSRNSRSRRRSTGVCLLCTGGRLSVRCCSNYSTLTT